MVIVADTKMGFAREAFSHLGEVRSLKTPEITHAALHHADALIIRSETRVGRDLLEGTPVRFVGSATIGVDHVDLDYLHEHLITFANAPGSNANSVAEYVVAGLLELAHRKSIRIEGKSLGIVGVGNIGSKVARYAEALGMRVLLNDPPLERVTGDPKFLPLDALMEADFLTLHVPLEREGPLATYHLFDRKRMESMKPGAVLLNTSRGAVVETEALRDALSGGHLSGAILDVWEDEPEIDTGLLEVATIGTAHIAGFSLDGKLNAARMLFDAMCRHFGVERGWKEIALPHGENRLTVTPEASREESLWRTIRACYDIASDDASLRVTLHLPGGERGKAFRALRAEYPVRREFSHYFLECPAGALDLCGTFNALGFRLR